MSRRYQRVSAPRCAHTTLIWEVYEAAQAAYWHWEGDSEDRPERPAQPEQAGYCEDCRRALYASREPWPAEVWAFLNAQAAADYSGKGRPELFNHPRKLPPAPKARKEAAAKLRARLATAYTRKEAEPRETAAIGRPTGDGYAIAATNGHCALVEQGAGKPGAQLFRSLAVKEGARYVELGPEFHLALGRVAICASERTHGVTLTVQAEGVEISTAHYESTARELIPFEHPLGLPAEALYKTCLNAEYLDPVCGVWPLRWYLTKPDDPQIFEPAGTEYRAVIMPMRE